MGNATSGDRRNRSVDAAAIHARMEGQAINIDKNKIHKPLVNQFSEDDQALDVSKLSKSTDGKENIQHFSHRLNVNADPNQKLLPIVIKWQGPGKDVQVAGNFNEWKSIPMVKSEKDFVVIVDLPEGNHEYKFLVDGEWKVNQNEKYCTNDLGTENNVFTVRESDFQELENALLRDPNDTKGGHYHVSDMTLSKSTDCNENDCYSQVIPEYGPSDAKRGPPVLPPHLLQVILNKDTPISCEPTLLPEPNHVMLNHMYALSIRDGTMVLSTSHRFRKKCVTTLIYRPI